MKFSMDEVKEMINCINEEIRSRIEYSYSNDNKTRLNMNKKALELDYKLLEKVLNYKKELEVLEEENN